MSLEKEFIDDLDEQYGRVLNENDDERADDTEIQQEFCINIEYEGICTIEECSNYATKISGREEFSKSNHEIWENLFDEVIMSFDDTFTLVTLKYRKGECQGEYIQKIEIEYDSNNKCISKWIDYFQDITIKNNDGEIDNSYNSVGGFLQKLDTDCKFDAESGSSLIDRVDEQISNVLSEHFEDGANDYRTREYFCDNIEYEAICSQDECDMFKRTTSGRDEFLEELELYQDLFDADTINYNDNMLIVTYRKGECEGQFRYKVEIEYDEENECILKWIDYLDEVTITDKDGLTLYDNSLKEFMAKMDEECQFDDENDEYIQQKEDKIEDMDEEMSDVINDLDDATADATSDDFCVDIEYEAVCNADECDKFKDKTIGREAFLDDVVSAVWQNLFDENTMVIDGNMLVINYRRGECEGEYRQRVLIEYDQDNDCVSKWIDYIDEATIIDKDGVSHAFNGWMRKLKRECKTGAGGYVYNVEVMYLENLNDDEVDEGMYVEVYGYGVDGDEELSVEETKVIEGSGELEWNEEFEFDDEGGDGVYDRFLFKLYGEDYLGETREISVSEIVDCTEEFEFRLELSDGDGKGCGLLVVIISKDGCDEGGGKGKNKKRLLEYAV